MNKCRPIETTIFRIHFGRRRNQFRHRSPLRRKTIHLNRQAEHLRRPRLIQTICKEAIQMTLVEMV